MAVGFFHNVTTTTGGKERSGPTFLTSLPSKLMAHMFKETGNHSNRMTARLTVNNLVTLLLLSTRAKGSYFRGIFPLKIHRDTKSAKSVSKPYQQKVLFKADIKFHLVLSMLKKTSMQC